MRGDLHGEEPDQGHDEQEHAVEDVDHDDPVLQETPGAEEYQHEYHRNDSVGGVSCHEGTDQDYQLEHVHDLEANH